MNFNIYLIGVLINITLSILAIVFNDKDRKNKPTFINHIVFAVTSYVGLYFVLKRIIKGKTR